MRLSLLLHETNFPVVLKREVVQMEILSSVVAVNYYLKYTPFCFVFAFVSVCVVF